MLDMEGGLMAILTRGDNPRHDPAKRKGGH
jgi:hypothetical protein